MRERELYEVWIDGQLRLWVRADSLADARAIAVAEFPRRAVTVRIAKGGL